MFIMKIYSEKCENIILTELNSEEISLSEELTVLIVVNEKPSISKTYSLPLVPNEEIEFIDDDLVIKDKFFLGSIIEDGIYHIKLILKKGDEFLVDKNCAFIDCRISCLLSEITSRSLKTYEKLSESEEVILLNMLLYSLKEGSNCGCNCNELQEIFNKLIKEINININTNECGC